MPVTRLTEMFAPLLQDAFERQSDGEDVWWDIAPIPSPGGVQMMVSVWIKGMVLGTETTTTGAMPPSVLKAEGGIDEVVRSLLEVARNERSKTANGVDQIAQMQEGLTKPNGRG